jgi:hypothetical protein
MKKNKMIGMGMAIGLAVVMVLACFNALVVVPQIAEMQTEGRGLTFPSEFQDMHVTGDAIFDKDVAVAGALTSPSLVTSSATSDNPTFTTAKISDTLMVTGTSTFGNVMTVNANGDFDSLSVAGNTDLTTINNTGANPVTVNDNLVVTGTTALNGAATITGDLTLHGFTIHSQASITPTNGGIVTPTAEIITLTPSEAVTVTMTACTSGAQTWLLNSTSSDVVILNNDFAALQPGDQTLQQYDTLSLVCIEGHWYQMSTAGVTP